MKIVALIARYLLALVFIVFGLNGFLHFIPQPPPTSDQAKQFLTIMAASHYLAPVFLVQLISGLLFLSGRTTPLALVCIAPVIVNILIYHGTMDPKAIVGGIIAAVLWALVFWRYRRAFDGILSFTDPAGTGSR